MSNLFRNRKKELKKILTGIVLGTKKNIEKSDNITLSMLKSQINGRVTKMTYLDYIIKNSVAIHSKDLIIQILEDENVVMDLINANYDFSSFFDFEDVMSKYLNSNYQMQPLFVHLMQNKKVDYHIPEYLIDNSSFFYLYKDNINIIDEIIKYLDPVSDRMIIERIEAIKKTDISEYQISLLYYSDIINKIKMILKDIDGAKFDQLLKKGNIICHDKLEISLLEFILAKSSVDSIKEYMSRLKYSYNFSFTTDKLLEQSSNGETLLSIMMTRNLTVSFGNNEMQNLQVIDTIIKEGKIHNVKFENINFKSLMHKFDENVTFAEVLIKSNFDFTKVRFENDDIASFVHLFLKEHQIKQYSLFDFEDLSSEVLSEILAESNNFQVVKLLLKGNPYEFSPDYMLQYKEFLKKCRCLGFKNVDIELRSEFQPFILDFKTNTFNALIEMYPILNELYQALVNLKVKNDNNEFEMIDGYAIKLIILTYRRFIVRCPELAYQEIALLIEKVKSGNFNFKLCNFDGPACYNPIARMVYLSDCNSYFSINTAAHELGHLLHNSFASQYKGEIVVPRDLRREISRIGKTNDALMRYNKAKEENSKNNNRLILKYNKAFKYINCRKYIIKKLNEYLSSIGLNPRDMTSETYRKYYNKWKAAFREEYIRYFIEMKGVNFRGISDIIDAIYKGKNLDGTLCDFSLVSGEGHGEKYYTSMTIRIEEIMANYMAILKLRNADDALEVLRSIVGDRFVNLLHNYYCNEVLNTRQVLVEEAQVKKLI